MDCETLFRTSREIALTRPGISAEESQRILKTAFEASIPDSELSVSERQQNSARTQEARKGCTAALDSLMNPDFKHSSFSDLVEVDMGKKLMLFRSISVDETRTINVERLLQVSMDGKHHNDERFSVVLRDADSDTDIKLNLTGWFIPPVDSTHGSLAWQEDLDTLTAICQEFNVPSK